MSAGAFLEVVRVSGLALVEDPGRPGRMHEGVPPGGPLVAELFVRANRAAASGDGAAAIERTGPVSVVARGASVRLATSEGRVVELAPDERVDLDEPLATRVGYIAVHGGVDAPVVLGGRGTLLVARLGGIGGRMLRKGDLLPVGTTCDGTEDGRSAGAGFDPGLDTPLRVVPSSDLSRFGPEALPALLSLPFTISALADRVGTRLEGPPLARRDADDARSTPMAFGAIQVTRSGIPIVLGPDHPTTGGYPILATVASVDRGRFFARRVGQTVHFCAVTLDAARRAARDRRLSREAVNK